MDERRMRAARTAVVETIDLGALLEADDGQKVEKGPDAVKGGKGGKGGKVPDAAAAALLRSLVLVGSPSRGTTSKDVRSANSRAATEPKALLRDLKVGAPSGGSPELLMASALQAARQNPTFRAAFGPPVVARDGDADVVMVAPRINKTSHPNVYISAIALALQNVGWLPGDFEPESRASRAGRGASRNIVQSNDASGTIVIAPKAWIADKARAQRRAEKNRS